VDVIFGISYEHDIDKAQTILEGIVNGHELVLKEPAAVIKLHELGGSSVNFVCRPWVKPDLRQQRTVQRLGTAIAQHRQAHVRRRDLQISDTLLAQKLGTGRTLHGEAAHARHTANNDTRATGLTTARNPGYEK
jgi:hypothetical protein